MVKFIEKRVWLTVGVLAIVSLFGGSARAYEAYDYSMYDNLFTWAGNTYYLTNRIEEVGCNTAVPYNAEFHDAGDPAQVEQLTAYLNDANARGVKVILSCKELLESVATTGDWSAFNKYINTFNSNPAVKGWYLADEPSASVLSVLQQGYDAIKKTCGSTKPVYVAFGGNEVNNNVPYNYRNAYDIMMYDMYPCSSDTSEFQHFKNGSWWGTNWQNLCEQAMAQANLAGTPFVNVLQAQGRNSASGSYRLPTYAEERFMTFWSVAKGSKGVSYWAIDQVLYNAAANPTDPYPNNGNTWLTDVAKPIGQELKKMQYALGAGAISNGVTDNKENVLSQIYRDPTTGKYFLLAVNSVDASQNTLFNINWSLGDFVKAVRLDGSGEIAISGGHFYDTFSSYGVGTYELISVPEPTAIGLLLSGSAAAALWRFWQRRKQAAG